jgi:hypothetical protein
MDIESTPHRNDQYRKNVQLKKLIKFAHCDKNMSSQVKVFQVPGEREDLFSSSKNKISKFF